MRERVAIQCKRTHLLGKFMQEGTVRLQLNVRDYHSVAKPSCSNLLWERIIRWQSNVGEYPYMANCCLITHDFPGVVLYLFMYLWSGYFITPSFHVSIFHYPVNSRGQLGSLLVLLGPGAKDGAHRRHGKAHAPTLYKRSAEVEHTRDIGFASTTDSYCLA